MKRKDQRGASVVEFAIILPLIVWLIFGIMEIGFVLYDKNMITQASREGARAGVVFRVPAVTDDEIIEVVNDYLGTSLITFGEPQTATVTVTRNGWSAGDPLKVTVSYTYTALVFSIASMGKKFNMVAETTMRIE
jgi:Flp pilus assembly protein TadG